MIVRGTFLPLDAKSRAIGIKWLKSIGMIFDARVGDPLVLGIPLFVELKHTPSQLAYFAHLDHRVSIPSVSELGVTFYAVSLELQLFERPKVPDFGEGDGYIFVPASNIVSISTICPACRW